MTSDDPWQSNELDEALSALDTPPADVAEGGRDAPPAEVGAYLGRTEFPGLFELEKESAIGLRGAPDEKIDYFRRALKKAEVAMQRFREAWEVRTGEMDSLEALAAQEQELAATVRARNEALESFVGKKREEFDAYGKRIAAAFSEKEEIEAELRQAKRETEEHLAGERREREEMAAELAEAREEHERELKREQEAHAKALREENAAQEQELRAAKREHENRVRQERREVEARLKEERALLETMLAEEREQREIALRKERAELHEAVEVERRSFAEIIKGHADDKAAAELELAGVQLQLQETELLVESLRRELDSGGGKDGVGELRARLAQTEADLERQREEEAELRGEAAVVESELLDRIEALEAELGAAREQADELEQRSHGDLEAREDSIRELTNTLELERRAVRDAELMQREQSVEFPEPAKGLDTEEEAKLERAVRFALKVVGAELDGTLDDEHRAEMFKRARIALSVANSLVAKS